MKSVSNLEINETALELWLELSLEETTKFNKKELLAKLNEKEKINIHNLISNGYLIESKSYYEFPPRNIFTKLLLVNIITPIYNYRVGNDYNFATVKEYLIAVQKQLSHFETEGKKSFLILRTMVEKIVMQAKDYLNDTFQNSSNDYNDNNQWINIPHVSPIGIYEPIGDIRKKFEAVMKELDISIIELIDSHLDDLSQILNPLIQTSKMSIKDNVVIIEPFEFQELVKRLVKAGQLIKSSKLNIREDIHKFSEEVHHAVKVQFSQLEENLGIDLIEQFDAIEELNELNPQRIRVKLEQTVNELNIHINSIYSRLLREINTLQLSLDVSKINIILTNEAGRVLKKISSEEDSKYYNEVQKIIAKIIKN